MINKEDIPLIKKKQQIQRIMIAPFRHGINYLKLMDMRKDIADQLLNNSFERMKAKGLTLYNKGN